MLKINNITKISAKFNLKIPSYSKFLFFEKLYSHLYVNSLEKSVINW